MNGYMTLGVVLLGIVCLGILSGIYIWWRRGTRPHTKQRQGRNRLDHW